MKWGGSRCDRAENKKPKFASKSFATRACELFYQKIFKIATKKIFRGQVLKFRPQDAPTGLAFGVIPPKNRCKIVFPRFWATMDFFLFFDQKNFFPLVPPFEKNIFFSQNSWEKGFGSNIRVVCKQKRFSGYICTSRPFLKCSSSSHGPTWEQNRFFIISVFNFMLWKGIHFCFFLFCLFVWAFVFCLLLLPRIWCVGLYLYAPLSISTEIDQFHFCCDDAWTIFGRWWAADSGISGGIFWDF